MANRHLYKGNRRKKAILVKFVKFFFVPKSLWHFANKLEQSFAKINSLLKDNTNNKEMLFIGQLNTSLHISNWNKTTSSQ